MPIMLFHNYINYTLYYIRYIVYTFVIRQSKYFIYNQISSTLTVKRCRTYLFVTVKTHQVGIHKRKK